MEVLDSLQKLHSTLLFVQSSVSTLHPESPYM